MISSYKVMKERVINGKTYAKEGDIVYSLKGYDYGCANDDTRMLGINHRSVTLKEDGDYPFFTIPTNDLEVV